MFSRNPMDSLQNAGVPVLKNPPLDPVISLQSAWDFQPFFELISIFIHGPRYFFYKMPWSAKVEVVPDLFTRWPHYKMTYKKPFGSGLKAILFGK
jgi:hypothetical protein